jgi:hypothetical protein
MGMTGLVEKSHGLNCKAWMMKGKTMDELIAALEQAMCWGRFHGQGQGHGSPDDAKYLALIRTHIADLKDGVASVQPTHWKPTPPTE